MPDGATLRNASIESAVRSARNMKPDNGVSDNFQTAVDKSLAGQPMTALALAVAVGFILGAIWKA